MRPSAPRRPTRSTTRSPSGSRADDYRPRALYERFGIEVLATTDDPCDDLAAHAALAADPTWTGRVIPTFRPDRYLEPALPGLARRRRARSARRPTSTPATTPATCERAGEPAPATSSQHGATAGRPRPRRRCAPTRSSAAEAERASTGAALAGSDRRARRVAFRRHMLFEMARMSCDDGLVMTLHPGVRAQPPPADRARFGPTPGHDIPARARVHRRRCARCWSASARTRLPPIVLSRSTRPSGRASWRRWPASTRRSTSGRRGGSSTLPTPCAASARRSPRPPASPAPRASSTTRARSARSRRATTCPAGSTPACWPTSWPSTASTRTRRVETAVDLVPDRPTGGVQAVTAAAPACSPRERPHGRGRPHRSALVHLGLGAFFRAHQAWYTDRAPDAARLGHRRVHRPRPRDVAAALRPKAACTRW